MSELGSGGFGTVFLGEHPSGSLAAVKVLHSRHGQDPEFRERFAREVHLARRVSSFCTAQVIDADPHGDPPWILSEYVQGTHLLRSVREQGPRTGSDLYRLAVHTATALSAIHAAGVVHRDFKPENIIIAPDGARVIDFGIARALDGAGATASGLIGTPAYMAPEQLRGEQVTPAIDVFAWGATIAFAATGREAFGGPHQAAVLHRVLDGEPDLAGVPEELSVTVRRCLAKEPGHRPDARALLATLLGYGDEGGRPDPGELYERSRAVGGGQVPSRLPEPGRAPFRFAGQELTTAGALAEAMQLNWNAAVDMLESAAHRQALIRWSAEEPEVIRALGEGVSTDVEVAWVIAVLRPDLPPCFRKHDMSLGSVTRMFQGSERWSGARWNNVDSRILAAVDDRILSVFSLHHCVDAEHGCPPGKACERYVALRGLIESAEPVRYRYHQWAWDALSGFADIREQELRNYRRRALVGPATAFLVESSGSDGRFDAEAVGRWAVERLPDGPRRSRVAQGILRADERVRAPVAVATRALWRILFLHEALSDGAREYKRKVIGRRPVRNGILIGIAIAAVALERGLWELLYGWVNPEGTFYPNEDPSMGWGWLLFVPGALVIALAALFVGAGVFHEMSEFALKGLPAASGAGGDRYERHISFDDSTVSTMDIDLRGFVQAQAEGCWEALGGAMAS
ncbi:serine/threonine-protein kinase [Nocardiopsis sp. CC223A]|uniref:serine/threonine-protein kinase n=1 Tax=Nocardiopsis sp. CC223A TaxID=3044051 RepID=UPI00278C432C|nr:serine/threonine-protein kinase [Nocardiopsis sp. CC223A]